MDDDKGWREDGWDEEIRKTWLNEKYQENILMSQIFGVKYVITQQVEQAILNDKKILKLIK